MNTVRRQKLAGKSPFQMRRSGGISEPQQGKDKPTSDQECAEQGRAQGRDPETQPIY